MLFFFDIVALYIIFKLEIGELGLKPMMLLIVKPKEVMTIKQIDDSLTLYVNEITIILKIK